MSIVRERSIACPRCGTTRARRVAVSLQGPLVPNLRAEILDGKFQRFACEDCGDWFFADGPMLWIDFEKKQWIGLFPSRWEAAWRALEGDPLDGWQLGLAAEAPPLVQAMAGGFQVRAVFGFSQLRDKLRALAAGLDDRWLEVLKLDLMRAVEGVGLHPGARLELVASDDKSLRFRNRAGEIEVPRARLAAMQATPAPWQIALEHVSGGPYVDTGRILVDGNARRP
jgi:hypothetical protein